MPAFAHVLGLALTIAAAPPAPTPEVIPPSVRVAVEADRPAGDVGRVEVLLLIDIDTEGRVTGTEVLTSGGPAFDDAAATALHRSRFQPATEGGVAIPVQIEYRYVFPAAPPPAPETAPSALEIDDYEEVRAPPPELEATQTDLPATHGERLAGVQGDAVKAARTLAGVARPPVGEGGLVIYGAATSETRLYVDWVPVPSLFHVGGARSILPTPAVDSVTVVPAGASAGYGRALGGFVQATTVSPRSGAMSRPAGAFARADLIDVGAGTHRRVGKRSWAMVALRRGVLANTYGSVVSEENRQTVPIPDSWDYQGKTHTQLSSRSSLEVLAFGSSDTLVRTIPSRTPEARFTERRRTAFHRVGLRYAKTRPDGSNWEASAWAGVDDEALLQSFGSVDAESEQRAWRGGLRLEQRRRLARFALLTTGVDLEARFDGNERQGALTLPRREGDPGVFGQPPGDRVGEDRWRTAAVGAAAYASVRFELARKRVRLEPGLRLEPLLSTGDRVRPIRPVDPAVGYSDLNLAVDPRLRIEWAPGDRVAVFAAGGRYHQSAASADRSVVFGNPRLRPAQADQAVAGLRVGATPWLAIGTQAYFVRSRRLATRSNDPTPPVAELLVADGDGRNYGGQVSIELDPRDDIYGRLVYALSRAERRGPGEASWRRFDFDQTHNGQALAGWRHRTGLELGGRAALSSGFPRTAVEGAVVNARTGQFDPVFGAYNRDRLPLFFELSLRVGFRRDFAWGTAHTWLDVQNATNRANAQEYFYNADYARRGIVRGLPVLPVLGVEVRI